MEISSPSPLLALQNFTISLVTDYGPDRPAGTSCVDVEGLDVPK